MRTKPVLTLEDCRNITEAAIAEAMKNKWSVTICITDDGGHTLQLTRMDGCAPVTSEIATLKSRIAAGRVALLRMPPLPVQGGVPILVCHAGIAALS